MPAVRGGAEQGSRREESTDDYVDDYG
jgi:hypothetical protein